MRPSVSEAIRQTLHVAMGGFALLLRVFSWQEAALLALAALGFNLVVLPRVGGRALYRAGDHARGYPVGILLYPLAVLLLILIFPARPDIAAAAWGVLAIGDGAATVVGRWLGGPRLPWNREKTWIGTAAFAAAGSAAAVGLAWWTAPALAVPPSAAYLTSAPIAAALVAALVETLPVRLDDNLSVPAAAAATLWTLSLVSPEAVRAHVPEIARNLGPAFTANVVVAALGWRARTVTVGGAVAGAVIGLVVYLAAGWQGWTLLVAAFLAAAATTRLGLRRKSLLGIAETRGGRRGPGNALANTGLAAVAAALTATTPYPELALVAFTAALVAGASDTVASEIGKAWGRHTFLITSLSAVPPGTSGGVSWEGTAAGVGSAAGLAAVALALGLIPASALAIVVLSATAASFAESILGATLEGRGILDNDLLNFFDTACAAGLAVALTGLVR